MIHRYLYTTLIKSNHYVLYCTEKWCLAVMGVYYNMMPFIFLVGCNSCSCLRIISTVECQLSTHHLSGPSVIRIVKFLHIFIYRFQLYRLLCLFHPVWNFIQFYYLLQLTLMYRYLPNLKFCWFINMIVYTHLDWNGFQ